MDKFKISVLDSASMGNDIPFNILESFGDVKVYESTPRDLLRQRISESDVIVINKIKITKELLDNCGRLKLITVFATGFDNIDIKTAREKGIAVCNVPGYSTDSVALVTLATVLSLATHLNEYNRFVKSGEYSESGVPNRLTPVYSEIKGKTWGIIGCGNIGKAVLRVAEALGASVIVNKKNYDKSLKCVDIDTLCRESDIITVHCPLNEETREIINKHRISLMKRNVILVNEARGAVLSESDVSDAVKAGRIGGFGCDVYSNEPFGKEHPFYEIKDFDNVILTPHFAWGAYESRVRCLEIISENIRAFLNGEIKNRVDLQ